MSISSCQPSRQSTMSMPETEAWEWEAKNLPERNKMIEKKPITPNVFSHAQDYEHILLLGRNKMDRKNLDEG